MANSKRPYHHPDLRRALLDAAMVVVDREGHEKLSLRALASTLGVSATAPQAHFANKQALLTALAERGFRELRERLERCAQDGAPIDVFGALADAYLAFAIERRGRFRLMFGADVDLDGDEPLASAGDAAFNVLRSAVRRHGAGDASDEETELKALMAWATVHGLAHICVDRSISSRVKVDLDMLRKGRVVAELVVRSL
ncbi:MAG: TetR/AcrR family transcriptional regulator [Pseudomonadota bacterium]